MYIIRDELTPAIDGHMSDLAFKNTMIRYWPRSTENGVETFGRLRLWDGIAFKDNAHRRIYKQIGQKIKDIESQHYSGIDYTYLYLAPYSAPNGLVTQDDIRNYISEYTPTIYPNSKDPFNPDPNATGDLNPDPNKGTVDAYWDAKGWITVSLVYTPTEQELVDSQITNAQILAKCRTMATSEIFFSPTAHNRTAVAALLDANSTVFESSIRVVIRKVVLKDKIMAAQNIGKGVGDKVQQVRYLQSANIEFKFRRTVDISVGQTLSSPVQSFLSSLEAQIETLDDVSTTVNNDLWNKKLPSLNRKSIQTQTRKAYSSYSQQLIAMSNWVTPFQDDGIITVSTSGANGYYISNENASIKVDGLTSLPPSEFKKEFLKRIKFDYKVKEKKGHWYDKVISIVIVVVAVVIAIISAGSASGLSAALISAATALSVGALALTAWGMYLAKNGGSMSAINLAGKISEYLGIAAMIAGIAAIYQSFAQQAAKEAAAQAIAQETSELAAAGMTSSDMAMAGVGTSSASGSAGAAAGASSSSLAVQGIGSVAQLGGKLGIIDDDVASAISIAAGGYESFGTGLDSVGSITLDSVANNISSGITKFFSQPLSAILNKMINWMNMGFNMYAKLVMPGDEGLADKRAELEALEKEVENTNPENLENVWKAYQDPYGSIFEVGDYYDKIYPMMTSGSIAHKMNECYFSWR